MCKWFFSNSCCTLLVSLDMPQKPCIYLEGRAVRICVQVHRWEQSKQHWFFPIYVTWNNLVFYRMKIYCESVGLNLWIQLRRGVLHVPWKQKGCPNKQCLRQRISPACMRNEVSEFTNKWTTGEPHSMCNFAVTDRSQQSSHTGENCFSVYITERWKLCKRGKKWNKTKHPISHFISQNKYRLWIWLA